MELRMKVARTTKDVDLTLPTGTKDMNILRLLQDAAAIDLKDHFTFLVRKTDDIDEAPEGGERFLVTARLVKELATFRLDIGVGDALIRPSVILRGEDWLSFAGIPPAEYRAICPEQQFAEKLHAYTLLRNPTSTNSRVKDIIDMVLLIQDGKMDPGKLKEAVRETFRVRGKQVVPTVLPHPPSAWYMTYPPMAATCGITLTLLEAHAAVAEVVRGL